jgi:anti-sigma regulatory factor (Ser/Thr protein kinase)
MHPHRPLEGRNVIRASSATTVNDPSAVATARRDVAEAAASLRFSEQAVGKAALVATELATNLLKHGGGGEIIVASVDHAPGDKGRLDIIAVDRGQGIANIAAAMQDGFSTAGSPGTGFGAIRRTAARVDIYSQPGKGTVVAARIVDETAPPVAMPSGIVGVELDVAAICLPKPREDEPGDSWSAIARGTMLTAVIADGLGHGPMAAQASTLAIRVLHNEVEASAEEILRRMHDALRPTRGAAVGLARIHFDRGVVEFAGVGNIASSALDESVRKMVSHNGIVGHEMRKVQTFTYPWTATSILVMHSDGLHANWSVDPYPGLQQRSAAVIAAVLYRDECRGTDDACVLVAK